MVDGSSEVGGEYQTHRAAFAVYAERSRKGDHRAALAAAHSVHAQVADPDLGGVALNCVGLAQFALGEFTSAAQSHERAKDLSPRSDIHGFAALRASLARIAAGEDVSFPQVWTVDSAPGRVAALARSEHPHLAPAAGVELGRILRDERNFVAAIRAYRAVVDSGHPWFRPRAAAPLAELLQEAADHDGAARVLDHARTGADVPDAVDLALAPLDDPEAPPVWLAPVQPGLAHYRAGDLATARAELRAIAAGDWRRAAHQASTVLAGLELRHGDPAVARQLLGALTTTADFTQGPRAAVVLAILDATETTPWDTTTVDPVDTLARYLTRDQDVVADLEALAQSRHPSAGVFAALLVDLLGEHWSRSEATHWRAMATRSENPLAAGYVAYLTAINLTSWDDAERVAEALTEARESTPTLLPWAAVRIGEQTLADVYRRDESLSFFQDALKTGHHALLPLAAAGLCHSPPVDGYSAEERYELAEELLSGDVPAEAVPPLAWLVARNLLSVADDLDGGRQTLERIPASDPEFGAPALAARLLLDEDVDGVRSVFERLTRWDEDVLEMASECCMSVLSELPDESDTTRLALQVLADLGVQSDPLARQVWERSAEVSRIQRDLDGELAAEDALNLRSGGEPGAGELTVARRCNLAGEIDQAITLYQRLNIPEFPRVRSKAAVELSVLFRYQGRHEEAEELLATGVDAQHCYELGVDLEHAGRIDEAILAWGLIVDTDDATRAAQVNYRLGKAYTARGETDAAITAFQRAGATEDSFFRGRAWHELGCLYQELGELALAKDAQQRGLDVAARLGKNGETITGGCQLRLVQLATLSGDTEEAQRRCLDMVDNGDQGTAAMGAMMLGGDAKDRRDVAEARRWYQWVIDSDDLFQRELALAHLGELYYWVGERDRSREFYQRTLDSPRSAPELVAEAAYRLGEMAGQDGDTEQAVRYLERARGTGDATFGPQATGLLGDLTG